MQALGTRSFERMYVRKKELVRQSEYGALLGDTRSVLVFFHVFSISPLAVLARGAKCIFDN